MTDRVCHVVAQRHKPNSDFMALGFAAATAIEQVAIDNKNAHARAYETSPASLSQRRSFPLSTEPRIVRSEADITGVRTYTAVATIQIAAPSIN